MILDWKDGVPLISFLEQDTDRSSCGVYLWICKGLKKSWIAYIGKASGKPSLTARQKEHVARQLGLQYSIPSEFRKTKLAWIPSTGIDYKETLLDSHKFLATHEESRNYLSALTSYTCPLKVDQAQIRKVERTLLWQLQPRGTRVGTRSPPADQLSIVHAGSPWWKHVPADEYMVSEDPQGWRVEYVSKPRNVETYTDYVPPNNRLYTDTALPTV